MPAVWLGEQLRTDQVLSLGPAATPDSNAALVLANPQAQVTAICVPPSCSPETQKRHRGLIRSTKEVGVVEWAYKSSTPEERQEKHKFKVIPRNI